MGATRRSVDNPNNDSASGWITTLYSCLAKLKPFGVRFVFNTNLTLWITNIVAKKGTFAIVWPLEDGYSTGGTLSFSGAFTDFTFGAADIESRVDGEAIITPSGIPTAAAGTTP